MSNTSPKPEDMAGGPPPLDTTAHEGDAGAPPVEGESRAEASASASASSSATVESIVDSATAAEVNAIRVAELEAELEQVKDKHLRALAEGENIRRRSQKDRDEMQKYGGVKLARDLLPVHDNLSRALKSLTDEQRAAAGDFVAGIELTERELLNGFAKHGIMPIQPEIGEKFTADRHQAMFQAPIPGAEPGTIIEVIQTGFMCNDRLVRAAMVGVAVAAPAGADADTET